MSEKINNITDIDWKKHQNLHHQKQSDAETRSQLAEMCSTFVAGPWTRVKPDQLEIKCMSSMSNHVYYVALPNGFESNSEQPREVIVRLYGFKWFDFHDVPRSKERQVDPIIHTLASEKKISPKYYGFGPAGEVLQYVQAGPFDELRQNDPVMVKKVAQKLAQIHHYEVPIEKTNNFFPTLTRYLKKAQDNKPPDFDFKSLADEINWLKARVAELNPPTVFLHGDYRNNNILIKPDNEVQVIDFEYAAYGYRGYDFCILFYMWGSGNMRQELPDEEKLRQVVTGYIDECVRINGPGYKQDKRNTVESLMKEVKLMYLFLLMYFGLASFSFLGDEEFLRQFKSLDRNTFTNWGKEGIKKYFELKKQVVEIL